MQYTRIQTVALALLIAATAGACAKANDNAAATGDNMKPGDSGSMKGMDGMPGMSGMSGMSGMMDSTMRGLSAEMQSDMQRMMTISGDSMKVLLPTHRQMVANMIAKMNGEMRDMKMTADGEWSATVDSLRDDLVRMPEFSGPTLSAMMHAHLERVKRLNVMHDRMMGSMKR